LVNWSLREKTAVDADYDSRYGCRLKWRFIGDLRTASMDSGFQERSFRATHDFSAANKRRPGGNRAN